LTALWLNQLVSFVFANIVKIAPDSGLTGTFSASGWTIALEDAPDFWAKLTYVDAGTGKVGSYSWVEQIPASGGGWTDGVRVGYATDDPARGTVPADPAWESSLNGTLPIGYRPRLSRDQAMGRLTFRAGICGSGGTGGTGGTGTGGTGGTGTGSL
jgi:hypothetical protein